jgi:two-component system, OmpR family, sensor histidine kinase SenX3
VNGLAFAWAVLAVGGIVALAVMTARYVKLRRELDAVLGRLGVAERTPRALYRSVRQLQRDLETAMLETARLRAAIEETDLGILIADRRGDVVFTNPAADRVMEGRQGDAVARSRVLQLVDRVTAGGTEEELEFDLYAPVRRMLRLRAVPLQSADGKGHAAVVYIADLTDRHRIEAIRRDFVANAGHELKTPLGALSVLAETLADADDPSVRVKLADRLRSEASRMARLVDDILELATIESLEMPHTTVVVADVLSEADGAVGLRAEKAGVALVGKVPPRELVVSGDHKQLVSAVSNLLDNAIKYTVAGGEGGTVWYRAWQDEAWVIIEVEDHGIGIADQHLERVFERFYRVDRARSRASGGTGLGLSIVRNVARTHGGEVTVLSELGVGSTFTMKLPASRE